MNEDLESAAFELVYTSSKRVTKSHSTMRSLQDSIHFTTCLIAETRERIARSDRLINQLYEFDRKGGSGSPPVYKAGANTMRPSLIVQRTRPRILQPSNGLFLALDREAAER
jgi:hypothetical protein